MVNNKCTQLPSTTCYIHSDLSFGNLFPVANKAGILVMCLNTNQSIQLLQRKIWSTTKWCYNYFYFCCCHRFSQKKMFKDTKSSNIHRKSKDRLHNGQKKNGKILIIIFKTLQRKLKIEHHEFHKKRQWIRVIRNGK